MKNCTTGSELEKPNPQKCICGKLSHPAPAPGLSPSGHFPPPTRMNIQKYPHRGLGADAPRREEVPLVPFKGPIKQGGPLDLLAP